MAKRRIANPQGVLRSLAGLKTDSPLGPLPVILSQPKAEHALHDLRAIALRFLDLDFLRAIRPSHAEPAAMLDAGVDVIGYAAFVQSHYREYPGIHQNLAALHDSDTAHLIVERTADSRRVGHAILTGLTDRDQGIRLRRICITEKGEGYGREALRLVIQLAFEQLRTPRLWLIVRSHNLRAQRLYQSEGFVTEAVPDAAAPPDSPITMSMLKPEGNV